MEMRLKYGGTVEVLEVDGSVELTLERGEEWLCVDLLPAEVAGLAQYLLDVATRLAVVAGES